MSKTQNGQEIKQWALTGEAPAGWSLNHLSEAAEVIMGQSPPGSSYNENGDGTPFFQGKAEFGVLHPIVKKWTTEGKRFAKVGDILLSVRAPVGPVNIADIDCAIGRGLSAIRAKKYVNQKFLYWNLLHLEHVISGKGSGSTFSSITANSLRSLALQFPSLEEQERIVKVLEREFTHLDATLKSVRSIEAKAAQFRRSLLHAAFTGALTGSGGGVGNNGLPDGWITATIDQFCEMYQPKTISKKELVENGAFPVFGANGQIGFYTKYNHEESEVTVGCRGSCGMVNVTPANAWITGNAMVVRPKNNFMSKQFLKYLLQASDFSTVITGSNQPQITRATLSTLEIVVPPFDEQEEIVKILNERLRHIGNVEKCVTVVNEKAKQLCRSFLHLAFTGRLTISKDESANV